MMGEGTRLGRWQTAAIAGMSEMETKRAVKCNSDVLGSTGIALLALGVAGMVAGVFLTATNAGAHDALPTAAQPLGWSYPFSCCSRYDCRGVAHNAIGERPEGYVIEGTGEVIGYTDSRIKNSPDGMFHWCSVAGANTATQSAFLSRRADLDSQNLAQNCVALGALYHGTGTSQLDLGPPNDAAR